MWTQLKVLMKAVKSWVAALCCHRSVYGGLFASHGWAAWVTQKPEVYVPMAALYLVLFVTG